MTNTFKAGSKLHSHMFTKTFASVCLVLFIAVPSSHAKANNHGKNTHNAQKPTVAWKAPTRQRAVSKPKNITVRTSVVAPRRRTVNNRVVYRRFGPPIYGYGFHYSDVEAARWLAFTSISLALINNLEEDQVRHYEQAQIDASSAQIGETITWNSGEASGSATAIREGSDASGYTCREFQQTITVGGQYEEAFGTACLQGDGSWRIVP